MEWSIIAVDKSYNKWTISTDELRENLTSSYLFWIKRKKLSHKRGSLYSAAVRDDPSLRAFSVSHSSLSMSFFVSDSQGYFQD